MPTQHNPFGDSTKADVLSPWRDPCEIDAHDAFLILAPLFPIFCKYDTSVNSLPKGQKAFHA